LLCSDFRDFDDANIRFCRCTPMHFAGTKGLFLHVDTRRSSTNDDYGDKGGRECGT
jgi:hypothetical protein